MIRLFANDIEDKPWFYDRDFWQRYLTMLATHRFNRFNLSLGLSYDFSTNLRDVYFFFAYPFLVNVPGYDVKAVGRDGKAVLPEEQQKNLEMIKYISDQAALRGLDFNLGIWTHSYRWTNSPNATYVIQGVTPENQGPYSRDAMHMILEACPNITGITLRTHGESGVPEGNFDIWKVIMSGTMGHKNAAGSLRKIEIDLHAKGMTQQMIDVAQSTGNPVTLSPKFWAEHMGLPYMQASIREAEMPKGRDAGGLMSLSSGTRSFMRYSFGDLLAKGRTYKVITRVWPGTQRLLLWGDPMYAAGYGRAFGFCGMDGGEYFDPLGFKGRAGSGLPPAVKGGGRSGYADASLVPAGGDWEKYEYQYRLMGRLMYNPEADAETWRRQLKSEFGAAAGSVETALATASRVLPLITTAHDAAAANGSYWPEVYVNQSIFDPARSPYSEMPAPHVFTSVSPLDPQMFAGINECAEVLLSGKEMAKVSPLDVAWQLEKWADMTAEALASAEKAVKDKNDPAFRRASIDAAIAAGVGRFFAHKFRAAVLFVLFDQTALLDARARAVEAYTKAREAWAEVCKRADGAYMADLTFGWDRNLRRCWADRLADIDRDIEAMKTRDAAGHKGLAEISASSAMAGMEKVAEAVKRVNLRVARQEVEDKPGAPATFKPGEPVEISAVFVAQRRAKLWYRHVHQGERYQSVEMAGGKGVIPAAYTKTVMPIQFYFEVEEENRQVRMSPGFGQEFLGVPYHVMMPA